MKRSLRQFVSQFIVASVAVVVSSAAMADNRTYTQLGNTIYGSNGTTLTRLGNTTYSNSGTSYTRLGNTVTGSNGSTYTRLGNTIYAND